MAWASGSLAAAAELTHILVDLAASVAVLVGVCISGRRSRAFPYGLYKVENLVVDARDFRAHVLSSGIVFLGPWGATASGCPWTAGPPWPWSPSWPGRAGPCSPAASQCPSKRDGGALGEFSPGMMVPEFDKVVFAAEVGVVHGPPRPSSDFTWWRSRGGRTDPQDATAGPPGQGRSHRRHTGGDVPARQASFHHGPECVVRVAG